LNADDEVWDATTFTISSMSSRTLRIEYSICSNCARNNFSGAIDGRPTLAYIVSNRRDKRLSTSSTISRMVRSGYPIMCSAESGAARLKLRCASMLTRSRI